MTFRGVDLPLPFGPTKPARQPVSIVNVTPSGAARPLYPAFRPNPATARSGCDECPSPRPSETAIELVRVEADQIDVAPDVVVQRVTIQSPHAHPCLFPSPPQHVALRACVRLDEHG